MTPLFAPALAAPGLAALGLAVLGACPGAAPSTSTPSPPSSVAAQPTPLVRLHSAQYSAYTDATEAVVTDRTAWEATWHRLQTGPAPEPIPAVDFARDMVVVVALGERPTGGTSVRVDDVGGGPGGVVVRYTVTEPGEGCMSAQVITAPVDVVRVPRAAGPVRFERRAARGAC